MIHSPHDTIVAISSAVGADAARVIVRMSGASAFDIARALTGAADFAAAAGRRLKVRVRDLPEFSAWIYTFRAPRSVTGEDVVEFHLPGNALLARMLLDDCVARGARPAEAGEFTARGYFNGRLDLAQAEGVAATIAAQSAAELRAARQLLAGELAHRLRPTMDQIADTLALVEAGIDFSEEDISFLSPEEAASRIDAAMAALDALLADSARFDRLTHEPTIALVGRPNAGKSTLLNSLAGDARAVVSPVAGTTRDLLSADVALAKGIVKLIDAAGIDETTPTSAPGALAGVERDMRERALRAVESADLLVLLRDCTDDRPELRLPREPDMRVTTKSDLWADRRFDLNLAQPPPAVSSSPDAESHSRGQRCHIQLSARTGAGMDDLRRRLDDLAFARSPAGTLALNARHVQLITDARAALARARDRVADAPELLSLELRESLDHLGAVLGQITPDDVLGRVFATFCVGK